MIEVVIDFVLIIFIVVFWYMQYKFNWKQNAPTPCVVENQTFTDPYGNMYTCDRSLQPVYNNYQPAQNYDGELSYFNLETHTISPYKPLDGYYEYKKEGLEPLYFKKNLVFPFSEIDGKIIIKNSCYGKNDNERVLVNPGELGIVDNTKGTPYAICKGGKILQIKYCDKYQDFIGGKCQDIDPCVDRSDGYILDVGNNMYRYCRDGKIEIVKCESTETLINYQCIYTPCKNAPDGVIISFDVDTNTYKYCQDGLVQIHLCEKNKLSSLHGCIDAQCIDEDGPNPIKNGESMYMPYFANCVGGKVTEYVSQEDVDDDALYDTLLINAYLWNGGYIGYEPYLKYPAGMYTPNGWKSYIDPEYMPKDGFYVTFKLSSEHDYSYLSTYKNIYNDVYVRVHFKLNSSRKVEATILDNLYVPYGPENISFTKDIETPATVYSRIAGLGYDMIILDEKNYVDLKVKPYYIQTCPDDYYVRFDHINPCVYKRDIISTNIHIPYARKSVLIWENEQLDNLNLKQQFYKLGFIPPGDMHIRSGEAVRYYDYILDPITSIQKISPFCGNKSLNPNYFDEDKIVDDNWSGLIKFIFEHISDDEEFEQKFYEMTFDPDYEKDKVVGAISVSSIDNNLFLYNKEFQALWVECIDGDKEIIKIDVSYIEYDPKPTANYPRGRYIAGYLADDFNDVKLYFRSDEPMYNYVYIYPKIVSELVENKEQEFCIVDQVDNFNIRVRRDIDYTIITKFGLNSHFCSNDLEFHFKMPICVYKGCVDTLSNLSWDTTTRRVVDCSKNTYISEDCSEDEYVYFPGDCHDTYKKFYKDMGVYIDTHPYISYNYMDLAGGMHFKSIVTKNYICGDKNTNLNSKNLNDSDMISIIKFILLNFTQDDFDYIYTISDDPDDDYIASLEYSYLDKFDFYTSAFLDAWYSALVYDMAIRIKINKPRYETITLDDAYFEYLTFGEISDDKISNNLYFIDYDNNDTNRYIYMYPSTLKNKLNSMFGITCKSSGENFKIVDIHLEKLYLYKDQGVFLPGPFSNPRIKDASFERLELDNDGFLPILAKYIRPKDAKKDD